MEENTRSVRAQSGTTHRPYYSITYRLSLSGRDLFAEAMDGKRTDSLSKLTSNASMSSFSEAGNKGYSSGSSSPYDLSFADHYERRRSHTTDASFDKTLQKIQVLQHEIPTTPKLLHNKRVSEIFNDKIDISNNNIFPFAESAAVSNASNNNNNNNIDLFGEDKLKKTRSSFSAWELELNRSAPMGSSLETKQRLLSGVQEKKKDNEGNQSSGSSVDSSISKESDGRIPKSLRSSKTISAAAATTSPLGLTSEGNGFITCLNSKNVSKYRVGQPYRKGIIIGIDEQQSKIIVYHANMPKGALVVLKTRNASRYEKGYPVTNVQGIVLGTVHAIDHVQNLLVVNTSKNGDESKGDLSNEMELDINRKSSDFGKPFNLNLNQQQLQLQHQDIESEEVHPFEANDL